MTAPPEPAYLWLGTTPGPPPHGPVAWAWARPRAGGPPFAIAAWRERPPRVKVAKVAADVIDPDGPGALVSLAEALPHVSILFDDVAVQQARRDALAAHAVRAVSTLVRGDTLFAGAITAFPFREPFTDPFARVVPARLLDVGPGLIGRTPHPAGPVIERYGADRPWPVDRFPG